MTDRSAWQSLAFGYGALAYVLGLATVAYAVGFLANVFVPKSVDSGATPRMTVGHLASAAGTTVYVLVGTKLEERDLTAAFGDRYRRYREEVPGFVPRPWRAVPASPDEIDGD